MSVSSLILDGFGGPESALILEGFVSALPGPVARTLITDGFLGVVSSLMHVGFSAYPGLLEPPPPGKQYVDISAVTWTGDSFLSSLSPAPSVGCVGIVDLVDSLGYVVVPNGDGTFIVHASGDNSLQTFQVDVWRPSDMFDWGLLAPSSNVYGSWTITIVPPTSGGGTGPGTGTGTGTGTPGTPVVLGPFSFVDPAISGMILSRVQTQLLPAGWFQQ